MHKYIQYLETVGGFLILTLPITFMWAFFGGDVAVNTFLFNASALMIIAVIYRILKSI